MQTIQIDGTKREGLGKKATKATRKSGNVPCVIYGGNGDNVYFEATPLSFRSLIYTPEFKLAEISVDGATYKCIIKDIQFHPVTDEIRHIDFLQLVDGHPIKVEIPIRTKGQSPGVKVGGRLVQKMRRVKVKTTPEHLTDEMFVNISEMELGSSIRVRDIEPIDGVEIMNPPANPVASVEVPRALRSATSKAAAEATTEE